MMIEITEKKVNKLSEHIEEGLRHLGKAMQCVDEWMQESNMGERGGYGNRDGGRYGNRYDGGMGNRYPYMRGGSMGYRDEDEEWEMQERRRRDSRGRYM